MSFGLLIFSFFRQGQSPPSATCISLQRQPKDDGRPPELHLSLDVQTSSTPMHFNVVYDTTPFLIGLPVPWAEMLTTRPPSPWFQSCFKLTFSTNFWDFSLKQIFLCPWNTLSTLFQSSTCFIFRQSVRVEWRHSGNRKQELSQHSSTGRVFINLLDTTFRATVVGAAPATTWSNLCPWLSFQRIFPCLEWSRNTPS